MMNPRTIAPTSNFLNKGHLEDSRTYSTSLDVQKFAYPNPMVVLCRNWLHNDTTQRTPGNVEGLAKLPRISIAQGFAVNQNESMNQNVCVFVPAECVFHDVICHIQLQESTQQQGVPQVGSICVRFAPQVGQNGIQIQIRMNTCLESKQHESIPNFKMISQYCRE